MPAGTAGPCVAAGNTPATMTSVETIEISDDEAVQRLPTDGILRATPSDGPTNVNTSHLSLDATLASPGEQRPDSGERSVRQKTGPSSNGPAAGNSEQTLTAAATGNSMQALIDHAVQLALAAQGGVPAHVPLTEDESEPPLPPPVEPPSPPTLSPSLPAC